MKFYVTNADYEKVKTSFLNFRSFSVIDVQSILQSFNYDENNIDEYKQFIVNNEIVNLIKDSITKKKFFNIIYINKDLDVEKIENLKDYLKEEGKLEKIIFIDENTENSKFEKFYILFDEVIFFPSSKRTRIMHCESIKNPLYHWINERT
jgi:hypothetical protein